MADKFLEEMEMEEIQEMMAMTKIGQILVSKGRTEGKLEGMAELISKKLAKGKSITEIADVLEETEDVINQIIKDYDL